MVNKHMNVCLSPLIIRKCKLKPHRDATTRLLEKLQLKNLIIPSVGEDVEQLDLISCWSEYKMVQSLWKTVWKFF